MYICSIAHSNSFFKHTNIPLGHHFFLQYLFHKKIPIQNGRGTEHWPGEASPATGTEPPMWLPFAGLLHATH